MRQRLHGVRGREVTATANVPTFTAAELARAAALQAADAELADVPIEDVAAFLADEIPAAAYEHP
jgi:hypothetical protein